MNKTSTCVVSIGGVIDLLEAGHHLPSHPSDLNEYCRLEALNELSPNSYVPESIMISLWKRLDKHHADRHVGLTLGQKINPNSKGLLTSWISQAATIGEALDIFSNNISLLNASESWELRIEGETCYLTYNIDPNKGYPTIAIERSMSALLSWVRALSQHTFPLLSAHFAFKTPAHVDQYRDVFGSDIKFERDRYCLTFSAEYLALPIPTSSRLLKEMVAKQANVVASSLCSSRISHMVRNTIMEGVESGHIPSVDEVSTALFMSRQTLARRLQSENTTFKSILDDVRQKRAVQEIESGKSSLIEISYLLGFQDSSSFYKAFRRWYGVSPGEYSETKSVSVSVSHLVEKESPEFPMFCLG